MKQEQFLEVVSRDEAARRMRSALQAAWGDDTPMAIEIVDLQQCLGRVLAEDVVSTVDVPGFDRGNLDGFAVRARDTHGASEATPLTLRLSPTVVHIGALPAAALAAGHAMSIPTGGAMPRGADAILMVEHSDLEGDAVTVTRAVTAGTAVTFAGTDISRGETLMRRGQVLTSREIGVLAAVGRSSAPVRKRPRVAVLSTGDEIVPPGGPISVGQIYDANLAIVSAAVTEAGGEAYPLGIVPDDAARLASALRDAIAEYDMVLLSGGTSKGPGDLAAGVLHDVLDAPGVVVHGVALRPGKPLCMALSGRKPVIVLPGFPTSAIFTFSDLVAPVLRWLGGRPEGTAASVQAELAVRMRSDPGRREYQLVHLVRADDGLLAYPIGKGSGSITTWSQADGYFVIPQRTEHVAARSRIGVFAIAGSEPSTDDLVIIGSHCVGLDVIVSALMRDGLRCKLVAVGSEAGLTAAKRGACDIAPAHLFDAKTTAYNRPFLTPELELVAGYRRRQGLVFRRDDKRFSNLDVANMAEIVREAEDMAMINRNRGSGTRVLYDQLLGDARPNGHAVEASSHHAVAAAVAQRRADWGIAIDVVAGGHELAFSPITEEHFDFFVPRSRRERPSVRAFVAALARDDVKRDLVARGFLL